MENKKSIFSNYGIALEAYNAFHKNCLKQQSGCRHSFCWNCEQCGNETCATGANLAYVGEQTGGASICTDCHRKTLPAAA